jgi:hypothetical protein
VRRVQSADDAPATVGSLVDVAIRLGERMVTNAEFEER